MASNNDDGATRRSGKQSGRQQEGSTQKPKKKAHNRPPAKENLTPNPENTPPSTPSKHGKSNNTNAPATEVQASKTQKKKGNQGARGSTPTPETKVTPPVTNTTPAKPVQIYAGPTFHASPAPSSLPIPKMFSKSMPQGNDKDASLRSMLQNEASGGESSEAEGSPSMRNSLLPQARGVREESPLDIFFRADKEEKARRHASASQSSLVTPSGQPRAQSTSPGPESGGLGRVPNDGSMFSLEMENPPRAPSSRLEDSPSVPARSQDQRAADAQAKTEALKSLLRFQGPDRRPASATHSLPSSRSSSTPPSAPQPFPHNASDPHLAAEGFPKRAYPQTQYHPQQRPNARQSSQLRQQLDAVANEHYSSNSSSPRAWPVDDPRVAHHRPQGHYPPPPPAGTPSSSHRASPGPPAFGPQDALRASFGQHPPATAPEPSQSGATSNEAMEEQLRRILKLDSLNAGVHT